MYGTELLSKVAVDKKTKPNNIETLYYLFWRKGISFKEFNELPIPYIFSIIKTRNYFKEQEEEAHKKAMKQK